MPISEKKELLGVWYVVQTFTGKEEEMKALCLTKIDDKQILKDCFIPYYEEEKKYFGKWHKSKRVLFPGYLFVITEDIVKLGEALMGIAGFTKILGDKNYPVPLTKNEIEFLCKFGGKNMIVGMSIGFIENDEVQIIKGPMTGMEGLIKKIDRHKRKATITIEMCGRQTDVQVGLEIVMKK